MRSQRAFIAHTTRRALRLPHRGADTMAQVLWRDADLTLHTSDDRDRAHVLGAWLIELLAPLTAGRWRWRIAETSETWALCAQGDDDPEGWPLLSWRTPPFPVTPALPLIDAVRMRWQSWAASCALLRLYGQAVLYLAQPDELITSAHRGYITGAPIRRDTRRDRINWSNGAHLLERVHALRCWAESPHDRREALCAGDTAPQPADVVRAPPRLLAPNVYGWGRRVDASDRKPLRQVMLPRAAA
jgi:hypothetical protein